jgi:drug/metabolite transporter (DMT)-like permease
MFQWRVIFLAVLAVILQLLGLLALALPDVYEGPVLYRLNEQHAICVLDGLGGALLVVGCLIAWGAGALWQRRVYAAS